MVNFVRNIQGILPPYMLVDLARRNPDKISFAQSLVTTQQLFMSAKKRRNDNVYLRFVGAGTGAREVYDAQRATNRPGVKARFEGDPAKGDADIDNGYVFTGNVRSFYLEVHGRNSIDANGMKMISTVHYDEKYNNAFWDGSQMTYGDGDGEIFKTFVLLDVCGHEITHGVTENVSGLQYYGQPGALNEHLSDVFGEMIEQRAGGISTDKADWIIGNGIFMPGIKGTGIRNMLNPGTAYDDKRLGKDPQPAHMRDYKKMSSDNGGVHYNSGIPNRAFALFAIDVGGFAWDKCGKIWYAARAAAGGKPSFAQFANHTVEACSKLGYSSELNKLKKAWDAVGIVPSATALDTDTPPPSGDEDDQDHSHAA